MIASLPMYDLPELRPATDAWWSGIRRHCAAQGLDLPSDLTRTDDPIAQCLKDAPVFAQTCGYPLTHALAGKTKLVATPRYFAPGCAGPTYVSWIVVRRGDKAERFADLRGRRVAFNGQDSQSGYNVIRSLAAPLAENGRFFGVAIESGAHRRSMACVAAGEADVAAIDCVTFALIASVAPQEVAGLRVLCGSAAAPALPYVTAATTDDATLAKLRAALGAAFADPGLSHTRKALLLEGCETLPLASYDVILEMERKAAALGYPELA